MKDYKVDMIAVFGPHSAHPEEVQGTETIRAASMKTAAQLAKKNFNAGLEAEGIPPEDVVFKVTDVSEV